MQLSWRSRFAQLDNPDKTLPLYNRYIAQQDNPDKTIGPCLAGIRLRLKCSRRRSMCTTRTRWTLRIFPLRNLYS